MAVRDHDVDFVGLLAELRRLVGFRWEELQLDAVLHDSRAFGEAAVCCEDRQVTVVVEEVVDDLRERVKPRRLAKPRPVALYPLVEIATTTSEALTQVVDQVPLRLPASLAAEHEP